MTPQQPVHGYQRNKTLGKAYLWFFLLGLVGGHHYYLGNHPRGVLYSGTMALFFYGWLADLFRMDRLVRETNQALNLQNIAANTAQQPPR